MSLELALILVVVGVIVVILLRRLSEQSGPKLPVGGPLDTPGARPSETQGDLVLITHPMIRMAAERALAKGGEVARFLVKEGDQIYFSFESFTDLDERQRALDLITHIQAGDDADLIELMRLVRRMFRQ